LEEIVDGTFKKNYRQMDGILFLYLGFGEIAMLYKTQRTSSVRALEECELWVIDRQLFKEAVE
jgi:hypothetical protein